MSATTLENVISKVRAEYDSAWYIWHGGEPLMAGEQFFHKVVSLQKKYYGKAVNRCGNTIQTNGTLLRSRFIEFCRDNRINLGISYEGGFDAGLRPDIDGDRIRETIGYMVKKGHMFSVTSTIHGGNMDMMDDIYRSFKSMNASFCYSPSLRMGCGLDNEDLYMDADAYADRCIEMFETWIHDKDTQIPVMPFNQYVQSALNSPNVSDCAHSSCLTRWICVYPDGSVYSCGKPCTDAYLMGNINEVSTIDELFKSEGFRRILVDSIARREKCKSCEIFPKCGGGCTVDAMTDGDVTSPGGFTCTVYKKLFSHIAATMVRIISQKEDLSQYNRFIRDAVIGKLTNPNVITPM